jgi:hypothetical protein
MSCQYSGTEKLSQLETYRESSPAGLISALVSYFQSCSVLFFEHNKDSRNSEVWLLKGVSPRSLKITQRNVPRFPNTCSREGRIRLLLVPTMQYSLSVKDGRLFGYSKTINGLESKIIGPRGHRPEAKCILMC